MTTLAPQVHGGERRVGAPVVGIVGGGQLARMTQRAAIDLGARLLVLAPGEDDPAVLAGAARLAGDPGDLADLLALAQASDVVTFDHERVPPGHLRELERRGHVVRPSPRAKLVAQDKLHARRRLGRLGFPVPAFAEVRATEDVRRFAAQHGWPVVLKARRGGYDGRGVGFVREEGEAAAMLAGGEVLAERCVPLDAELSVLVARRPAGEAVAYPVCETVQVDGMCRELRVPAPVAPQVARRARELALAVAEAIDATGVLALELFLSGGELLVNELALRPHNSGHWTIEGAVTSQFENHLRAVLDWPLGSPDQCAPAVATVNVVGPPGGPDPASRLPAALAVRGAHVHLYGKAARPGRKLGHVTALGASADDAAAIARAAAGELTGA